MPSGPLPPLPVIWVDDLPDEENLKSNKETMPPVKKPHLLLDILMRLRVTLVDTTGDPHD